MQKQPRPSTVVHSTREYYSLPVIVRRPWNRPTRGYHDRIEGYTGKMVVQMEAVTPLHIGSGDYELDTQGLYIPFARKKGLLYIPGTSIKGAIRAHAEALSPSCEGGGCRGEELCICCHIFGTQGLQGRVTFCDTEGLGKVKTQILSVEARWSAPPARAPAGGRRFYRHAQPGLPARATAQERLEVVPKGTKFKSEVFFTGLTKEEMGLLLLAMGLWQEQPFLVKMGGGKNRGLGSVRLDVPDGVQLVGPKVYSSLEAEVPPTNLGDLAKETVPSYLARLKQHERQTAINNLQAFRSDPP